MPDRVVDASAMAAMLFGEPEGESITDAVRGMRLIAPAIMAFELYNVCATRCRREPARRDDLVALLAPFAAFQVTPFEVDHDEVLVLATGTGLTHYDASYLWLSRLTGAPLITLDRALARAASA